MGIVADEVAIGGCGPGGRVRDHVEMGDALAGGEVVGFGFEREQFGEKLLGGAARSKEGGEFEADLDTADRGVFAPGSVDGAMKVRLGFFKTFLTKQEARFEQVRFAIVRGGLEKIGQKG